MSLDVNGATGRVILYDAAGNPQWDSNWNNLLITDQIQASFTLSAVNNSSSGTQYKVLNQVINLGAVDANANVFFGMHKDGSTYHSIGGTHFAFSSYENMDPAGDYRYYTTGTAQLASGVWYFFRIASGYFQVVVNYRFPAGAQNTFGGRTVNVAAFCGTFDY